MEEPNLVWDLTLLEDTDDSEDEWEDLCSALTELMAGHTSWHGSVENFGWRRTAGELDFTAETGKELLAKVLPKTDCTFHIFSNEDGSIHIQNWHHDSPSGIEWYYLTPIEEE